LQHELPPEVFQIYPSQIIFGGVAVILAIIGWIFKFRPRVTEDKIITKYVDDELRRSIEQHEYTITWGKTFFLNKIILPELPFGVMVDITIQPLDLMEVSVPKGAYEDVAKKNSRKIILKDKRYFQSQHVNKIFVLITTPISADYRDNVTNKLYESYIEIENRNIFEIKNYQLKVDGSLDLQRISNAITQIQGIRFDLSLGTFSHLSKESLFSLNQRGVFPILILDSVPSKTGSRVTKFRIPLN